MTASDPLLRVRGLGKSFGGNRAVDGIDFDVARGELLAMIGPNGAGKSTTFNMVNGQLPADSGSITLEGHELRGLAPRQIWQRGVGRTFQIAETFASLTVLENVQMALLSADRRVFSFLSRAAAHRRDDALALQLPATNRHIVAECGHLDLLCHPTVQAQLLDWLGAPPRR